MADGVRDRMVQSAVVLLAKKGVQATSFSGVLEASGAPRGSLYHHFPGGKDELIAAAVDLAGGGAIALLDGLEGRANEEILDAFLGMWRSVLTRSNFSAGCSVLAVTISPTPESLDHAATVFRAWRRRLAELLHGGGLASDSARRFATTIVAATEGAVVLSRAEQSLEAFDLVGEDLRAQLSALSAR